MRHRSRAVRLGAAAVLLVGAVLGGAACSAPTLLAACSKRLVASTSPPITDPALVEISGIAASRATPGLWWVHNDSGDSARVFAIDENGVVRATLALAGASAADYEDIAVGEGPVAGTNYLYVADIGDNPATRPEVVVYRMVEPTVPASGTSTGSISGVEVLRLRYPDGAHDAESLVIDPISHSLVILTKNLAGGAQPAYRVSTSVAGGSTTTMAPLASVPSDAGFAGAITGADISRDGLQLAIRTYGGVRIVGRNADLPLERFVAGGTGAVSCPAPVPSEFQGEAVGFRVDGRGYITVSEGAGAALHRYLAP